MSVSVKVTADVSGFEGGMAKASNALNRLFDSERKVQRSIKGLAMDLTNVSGPADLVTRAFFRMENAMQLGTSATVAMAGAMYVFNDFKKYRAYVDDLTKSIEAMQKQFDRRNMSSVEREVLGLSDKQGELGNRVGGVGAAAQNVYAASPFNAIAGFIGEKSGGDYRMKSTVEEAVELYKKIEQVKKNIAQIDQENREKEKAADNAKMAAEANQVKNAYEKLAIEKGQGPIAAYIFEQKLKIAEAEKQGNTALAKNLSLLTDYNVRLMGNARVEEHIKKIKDEQTKADEKRKKEEEETASIKQRNDKRIIDRERGRLPIMDQIEAKTQDIEAMRAKMADMSGPEAEKMREAIIGEEDKLQGLLDKAKTSTSVTTSKGSLITDSLARVGGGGGVFQSGPQQSFTKITSNTDQLVKLATSINERIGPGTVYVE